MQAMGLVRINNCESFVKLKALNLPLKAKPLSNTFRNSWESLQQFDIPGGICLPAPVGGFSSAQREEKRAEGCVWILSHTPSASESPTCRCLGASTLSERINGALQFKKGCLGTALQQGIRPGQPTLGDFPATEIGAHPVAQNELPLGHHQGWPPSHCCGGFPGQLATLFLVVVAAASVAPFSMHGKWVRIPQPWC